jgi:hypothetical protein
MQDQLAPRPERLCSQKVLMQSLWPNGNAKMTAIDGKRRKAEPTPLDAQKDGQTAISQDDPTLELDESGSKHHEVAAVQAGLPSGLLSDQQIAILCDVADGHRVKEKYEFVLNRLLADGFLESVRDEPAGYKLTGKAQQLLAERGTGLNET